MNLLQKGPSTHQIEYVSQIDLQKAVPAVSIKRANNLPHSGLFLRSLPVLQLPPAVVVGIPYIFLRHVSLVGS